MHHDRATLELRKRDGRLKYYLADRPVSGGDPIDLCFAGGWVTGRFEWNGDGHVSPQFHYSITLLGEGRVHEASFVLPEDAIVRWPHGTFAR